MLLLSTAPHICVVGLIISLMLGYRISIDRDSTDFCDETMEDMVKKAKKNVQSTVNGFANQFSEEQSESPVSEGVRSEAAASGTRPVNVPFSDGGSVDVRDDGDGYHEADIQ